MKVKEAKKNKFLKETVTFWLLKMIHFPQGEIYAPKTVLQFCNTNLCSKKFFKMKSFKFTRKFRDFS